MKRANFLLSQIIEMQNLQLAFWKACRRKHFNDDVLVFSENLTENLELLQSQILSSKPYVGNYFYFSIRDPKPRIICAASFPERVLHHALMNVCHPVFEKTLIYHTYATRRNKGTFKAKEQAEQWAKKYPYFAKLDVRKYFDSISHLRLKRMLAKLFKEPNLLEIFYQIIDTYNTDVGKGLPIGNLTSQYFANYYLSAADHFAIETLKLPYIRYMDDMLFFAPLKDELIFKVEEFIEFLNNVLDLQVKQKLIASVSLGVPFLGFKIFRYYTHLNKQSKKRFYKKMKYSYNKLASGEWSQKHFQQHVIPLIAFSRHADSLKFRKKCIFTIEGQILEAQTV